MKKRGLVIGPVMPQPSDKEALLTSLRFLSDSFEFEFIDPLSFFETQNDDVYYERWRHHLVKNQKNFDALFGFSFGGVILTQCLDVLEGFQKPIVLFSTPSFADEPLKAKLGNVVRLCREAKPDEALSLLQKYVSHPRSTLAASHAVADVSQTCRRTIVGLERVLNTDSRAILENTKTAHTHFVSEQSDLVNLQNVVASKACELIVVPSAGMRMLQDNPSFCQSKLIEILLRDA